MIPKSPFADSAETKRVIVAHGKGPYANTVEALEQIDLSAIAGKRVLLKPNVGRVATPDRGIVTNPEVVAAAIDVLRQAGAEVAIGESPITGVKVMEAFEAAGITAIAAKRDCPLIDMDERPPVEIPIPQGRALGELKLCADVLDFDAVVSIPVMKMHMHTGATLSIKNMKGCLWRRSKVGLHMLPPLEDSDEKPINVAIADLSSVLRPHLAIIDGTIGMEGLGPSAGQAKPVDTVVVGFDGFAADAVACRIMGTDAKAVPYLAIGAERGYGVIDIEALDIAPANWIDWIDPFAAPPSNLEIAFPNVTVLDNGSCSACQSTLLLFLTQFREQLFDYMPDKNSVHIAIGKHHTEVPEGTLCIGNCTARHRKSGIFVPGCPPVSSEILKAITGRESVDDIPGIGL